MARELHGYQARHGVLSLLCREHFLNIMCQDYGCELAWNHAVMLWVFSLCSEN